MKLLIALTLLLNISYTQTFTSTAPTWNTDPTFQAGSSDLIFVASVSAPHTQSYQVTFSATAATNPPIFTFGLKTYRGTFLLTFRQRLLNSIIFQFDNSSSHIK